MIEKVASIKKDANYDAPIALDACSKRTLEIAKKIAPTNAIVLITGETGVGKEILSRYIHRLSNRASNKFVAINCAAIPETLLESEFFGHERGAFTNALQRRVGKFEDAHQGTILLDEISEMPLGLQSKLLRVIQEREFSRLGSNESIKMDARIIVASNRNLREAIVDRTFREDLFYRLNVIHIEIPNLSLRPLDSVALASLFCKMYSNSQKKLSPQLLQVIKNHTWKGNVRELENFVHRSVLLSEKSIIDIKDAKFDYEKNYMNDNIEQKKTLAEIEKDAILDALEKSHGNKNAASEKLGIPIRTLRHKLCLYEKSSAKD